MPSHFLPAKSELHRAACLSLYRGLLNQCNHIPIPEACFRGPIHPLKHLIRKQFRRNVRDTSHHLVTKALEAGYHAENLFHEAASGSQTAQSRILTYLENLQAQSTRARAQQHALNPADSNLSTHQRRPPIPAPYPGSRPMLETRPRPFNAFPGPRRVPKLIHANGFPMLRYQKPQSAFLSRVLRDKLKAGQKSLDWRDGLRDWGARAKEEDEWERSLGDGASTLSSPLFSPSYKMRELGTVRGGKGGEPSWEDEIRRQSGVLHESIQARAAAQTKLARNMLAVVDKERSLAMQERGLRRREAGQRRRQKKREGADNGQRGQISSQR